jgi:hypothetical protein
MGRRGLFGNVRAVRALALPVSAAVAVAIACVWACLPDLVIAPLPAPPGPVCGDGVISPSADGGEECDPGPDASSAAIEGCVHCQVACGSGEIPQIIDPRSHHCYFNIGDTHDSGAAASECEALSAHVVRFVSEAEVSLVDSYGPPSPYWVGLKAVGSGTWLPLEATNEPGWNAECSGCFAQVDAGATFIPVGSDPLIDVGLCVVASFDPTVPWNESICGGKDGGTFVRETMCEREPVGTRTTVCPQGACFTVAQTQSAKSYVLIDTLLGSNDAVQACAALDGGLALFQSAEEREQVGYEIGTEHALDAGPRDFWIALSSPDGKVWAWDLDAGGVQPLPWATYQPADAGGPARAYVIVQPGLDSELAFAGSASDAGGQTHHPLCQIP